jgi:hypothetical protein
METRKKYMKLSYANGYRLIVWDEAGLQKSYTFVTNLMTALAMLVLQRKGYTEIKDPI